MAGRKPLARGAKTKLGRKTRVVRNPTPTPQPPAFAKTRIPSSVRGIVSLVQQTLPPFARRRRLR